MGERGGDREAGGGGGGVGARAAGMVRTQGSGSAAEVETSPFELLGGAQKVRAIVERFYDAMSDDEPVLARLHACDADGRVSRPSRDRFGMFLIGWLGGPQDYVEQHGHPRLRRRHAHVTVDETMRDAWLRCMKKAMDAEGVHGPVREFLDVRLHDVANFLRNVE